VLANVLRGGLSFITVLILARGLGPERYGDFAFLIGSFVAIKILLGMGTPNAFYTFMSRKPRGGMFLTVYAAWQLVQFSLPILFIVFVFPDDWVGRIWVGQDKELVLLSFAAVFMQQQAWYVMVQIGESTRLTHRVQTMNISIALAHLLIVCGLWITDLLSLNFLFTIIAAEYVVATVVAFKVLNVADLPKEPFDGQNFREYVVYCSPLIIYSLLGFAHEFADRWLLQSYGGSEEQGLYEVGYRFATVSMWATTSLLNIFWKEFTEARDKEDLKRMQILYTKASRFLFAFGAIVSGFFIPWSEDIVRVFLGPSYSAGAPVLAIMLLFSIYAAAGQINGTLLYAASRTKEYLVCGAITMALSIPLAYFVQAPPEAMIPGLELGAVGMALKRAVLTMLQLNVVIWWIRRSYGWKFDWAYQVVGLAGTLFFGWVAHEVAVVLIAPVSSSLILSAGLALFFYIIMVGIMIWAVPWVAGLQRDEFLHHLKNPFKVFGH